MEHFFKNPVASLYHHIFGEKISDATQVFLKNISYVAGGTAVAAFLSFVFNVLAGRMLGPAQYGIFALVNSIAIFLYIPMLPGINVAMVKYVAKEDDVIQKSNIVSLTYMFLAPLIIISTFVFLFFSAQFSKIFSVSPDIFILSVIFAIFFTLYTIGLETVRALHNMKAYSLLRILYGITLVGVFLLFMANRFFSFRAMLFATYAGFMVVFCLSLFFYGRKYLAFRFDKSWSKVLIKYSLWSIVGILAFAIYSSFDKILIHRYLPLNQLGIYESYQYASINVMTLLFGIFNTVFFPTASKHEDKKTLFKKINKFLPYVVVVGIPFIFSVMFVILKLYGRGYPFNPFWALLSAVACVFIFVDGAYGWTLASIGEHGAKIVSIAAIVFALTNIVADIILIPRIGIAGAIIGVILAFATSIGSNLFFGRKYLFTHTINK